MDFPLSAIKKTHRLPNDEYFQEETKKSVIMLHHTVSGSFDSVWSWWNRDQNKDGGKLRVATAYIVDVNGDIYEVFDPKFWCHHLGLKTANNLVANKRSIGIELVSEGGLIRKLDGKLYWFNGTVIYPSKRPPESICDIGTVWRGYRYFDNYDTLQLKSLYGLVNYLCERFGIPKMCIDGFRNRFEPSLIDTFEGVLTHCNLREDKSDVHLAFPWNELISSFSEQYNWS